MLCEVVVVMNVVVLIGFHGLDQFESACPIAQFVFHGLEDVGGPCPPWVD